MKKGQIDLGSGITSAILFGVFVITLVMMGVVNSNLAENTCTGTAVVWNETTGNCVNATDGSLSSSFNAAYNVTQDGQTGFINMSNLLPTLGTILVAVIIIGALFLLFRRT